MRTPRIVLLLACLACGAARAADGTLDAAVFTPRQQAIIDRVQSAIDARVASSDLRLRIIASLGPDVDEQRRPEDNGFYAQERITSADLYEQARGSTDPLALQLLVGRCSTRTKTEDRCDRLALARRWVEADTQNQFAWIELAAQLKERGQAVAATEAFHSAATASRWQDHYSDVARLIGRTIPDDWPVQDRSIALYEALTKAGLGLPIGVLQTIQSFCKAADTARDDCARVVQTMARDTDTLLVLDIVPRFAALAGMPRDRIADYQQRADAAQWLSRSFNGESFAFEVDEGPARMLAAKLTALIADGELGYLERRRLEAHLSQSDAAAGHVATLSAEQLARRPDGGRP